MTHATLSDDGVLSDEDLRRHIRHVSDDEVEEYREMGCVKLSGFMSAELADLVSKHVKSAAGYVDAVGLTEAYTDRDRRGEHRVSWYSTHLHQKDDFLRQLAQSRALGEAHARLIGCDSVRLWSDSTNTKQPGGEATPWHQDMQAFPFDRPDVSGMWVALVEMTPEMAPLQHLIGSHKEPWIEPTEEDPTRIFTPGAGTSAAEALAKYPKTAAGHLDPGDTICHHGLTFHGTETANETDRIRWTWISQRFASDILYTGKKNTRSDGLGLRLGQPLDHPYFPVVYEK